jgi:protein-S-isoprenylcysteine O-methyltransferase Ste14
MDDSIIKVIKSPKGKVWLWLIISSVLIGFVLFLSVGTINYWQAWIYLGVGAASSVPVTLHIMKDPMLLENRTKAGPTAEPRPIQKIIVACLGIPGIAAFIVPGFDHRFGWSSVPAWLAILGDIMIIVAMWMVSRVFKENSYGSATVEITQDQEVISTGPYAMVRNPMYSSAVVYFIGMALALGSYWGLIPASLAFLVSFGGCSTKKGFLPKICPAIGTIARKFAGTSYLAFFR